MPTNKAYKKYTIISVFLLIYLVIVVALVVWLFKKHTELNIIDALQSPSIIILATVVSVLTFTVSSAVFSALGKGRSNLPLGMPDGSIRALIALSLITLFFILATQIYAKVSQGNLSKVERISEDRLKDIPIQNIVWQLKTDSLKNPAYVSDTTKKGTIAPYNYYYNVTIKTPSSSDASDMAKNIIASFIALIAAISGFYFGSASSRPAVGNTTADNASPKITPNPNNPTVGKVGEHLTFEWTVSPPGQQIDVKIIGDTVQPVQDSSNPLKYIYSPSVAGSMTITASLKNNTSVQNTAKITVT